MNTSIKHSNYLVIPVLGFTLTEATTLFALNAAVFLCFFFIFVFQLFGCWDFKGKNTFYAILSNLTDHSPL